MRFDVLATLLADAGCGVPGQTLFIHHMPAVTTEGLMLRAPLDGIAIDHTLPGYYKTKFQVIVRARTQEAGEALCRDIMAALTMGQGSLLEPGGNEEALWVNHIRASHLPIVYPRSEGNGLEWSINFDCCYVLP